MPETIWILPILSQEILSGPVVTLKSSAVLLEFTYEELDCEISFDGVLTFIFTEFTACREEHLSAYDKIVDYGNDSELARHVLKEARGDVVGLRHYCILFDDFGSYDVIARSVAWRVESRAGGAR